MAPQRLRQHLLGEDAVVLVVAHGDFAQDDLPLHLAVGVGNEGVEDHLRQGLHRGLEAFLRSVDVIDRPVKRRIGVGVAARTVHGLGQFSVGKASGTLEDHVLQIVRDPRTFPATFLGAAGAHPSLHRAQTDVRTMDVNDLQAVREDPPFRIRTGDLAEAEAFEE